MDFKHFAITCLFLHYVHATASQNDIPRGWGINSFAAPIRAKLIPGVSSVMGVMGVMGQLATNTSDAGCGSHELEPGNAYRIKSAFYDYGYYPSSYECNWNFLGTKGCIPIMSCESFKLVQSTDCSRDYLEVSDSGGGGGTKYCGETGPNNVTTGITILNARFVTGVGVPGKGFNCSVSCMEENTPAIEVTAVPKTQPEKMDCECGIPGKDSSRIVNGQNSTKYYWKWQAALVPRNRVMPFCGGALISNKFILTAAHCVVTTGLVSAPTAMEVVLNEYDLDKTDETQTIRIGVVDVTVHPFYSSQTQDYDISLIELAKPVTDYILSQQEPKVTPVCLPPQLYQYQYVNETATVVGWGATEEGGEQAMILQQVDVPVITNEECGKQYAEKDMVITARMLCGGYSEGQKDSCQGDSGGPYMYFNTTTQRYTEIGIVSFGEGCARPNKAGVYTRVTEINDWVRMHVTQRQSSWCREP